jgi:hypothetical protein
MKVVSKKVSIGSEQISPEAVTKLGITLKLGADGKVTKYTIPLGEVSVNVPETAEDVQAMLASTPAVVIDTLARQLVTDKRNEHRKAHQKAGATLKPQRDETKAWLFTPEGMQQAGQYVALLQSKADEKAINAELDRLYKEFIQEDESA